MTHSGSHRGRKGWGGEKKAQTRLGARQKVVSAFLTFSGKFKESRTQGSPRLSCLWALVYWSWKTGVCKRYFGVWWKKSEQTLTAEVWSLNKCQVWLGTPDWTFPKIQLELPIGARGDLWPLANKEKFITKVQYKKNKTFFYFHCKTGILFRIELACRLVWLATITERMPIGSSILQQTGNNVSGWMWEIFRLCCMARLGRKELCHCRPGCLCRCVVARKADSTSVWLCRHEQMEAWRVAPGAAAGGEGGEGASARVWCWPPASVHTGAHCDCPAINVRSLQWHSMRSHLSAAFRTNQACKKMYFNVQLT